MRVALVAEDYFPQLGGIPEHVHNLALELNARGHEALVIAARMRGDFIDPPFVRRIGRSLVIYANGGLARVTVGRNLTAQVTRILQQHRSDVVHVHGGLAPTLGLVGAWAARRAGIPLVATFHSWFPRSIGYRLFRRPLQAMLDRHAAAIAVSSTTIEALGRYFHANWEVIPNGVDTDTFTADGRRSIVASGRHPRLLFLGRLEPRTGLHVVLAAMPRVLERFPDAELAVAGAGPWLDSYRKQAASLGGSVRFIGRVLAERPDLYRDADIYLCPTSRASFGVTLLEAMACGTPIIASDLAAFREVAGQEALLVAPEDPDEWADTTIALLEDAGRREAMSRAGRAAALGFAWPRVTERIVRVYERVTATSPPSPRNRRARIRAGRSLVG